jgi:beta-phosphoglucomutase
VVSGALRPVVEAVLAGSGLRECFTAVVTSEDTPRGKPDPAGYLLALEMLGASATDAAALEDSPDGVAAASAAGLYTVAVLGTAPAERLTAADEIVARLDAELIERLLSR